MESETHTEETDEELVLSELLEQDLDPKEADAWALPELKLEESVRRREGWMMLVAVGATTSFFFTEIITQNFHDHLAAFAWLALACVASWIAYFRCRRNGATSVCVAVIGFLSINAALADVHKMGAGPAVAQMSIVLLWTGVMMRPLYNIPLGLYIAAALPFLGVKYVPVYHGGLDELSYTILFFNLGVPLVVSATIHSRNLATEDYVRSNIAVLQNRQASLIRRLKGKAKQLQRSQKQLARTQQLRTVGTMASGLAHELNNILTPIRGLAELIAQGNSPEQNARYGQRILDSAVAAAQITSALLTYTRQGSFQPVRSNAGHLLHEQVLPVLSKSLPSDIKLRVNIDQDVSIDVDRLLFQQCIANLIFNAVDAMPKGGEIYVGLTTDSRPPLPTPTENENEVEEVGLRSRSFSQNDSEHAPKSVRITVTDTGTGIQAKHLSRIFDPFFTTKPVGSGTGLGLPMVQGSVTRHGGSVSVQTSPGQGTTFTILLPLAPADENRVKPEWPALPSGSTGPVVIVVAEDEDTRDEFEELLRNSECTPICTTDVHTARHLLSEMGDKVDLLVLDTEIPNLDTDRVFLTIREINPNIPIILLTTHAFRPTLASSTRMLRKPVNAQLFATLMTHLLHNDEPSTADEKPVLHH